MNNLFSIFDPVTVFKFSMNWLSVVLVVLLFPTKYWISKNKMLVSWSLISNFLHQEIKLALGSLWVPGASHFLLSIFMFILLNNFLGLMPYVFTASSHLSFTLSLALVFWAGLFISSVVFTPNQWMSHLVPLGTPSMLIPFMVIIELISSMIRPITLSVRLAANMVAGHLLLALLSGPMAKSSILLFVLIFSSLLVLALLEVAVSFIQAYVFMTLSSLYIAESSNPHITF